MVHRVLPLKPTRSVLAAIILVSVVLAGAGPMFSASAQAADDGSPSDATFYFSRFEFVGDVLLPVEPLYEAFQPLSGTELSMDDLLGLAAVVESYYAAHGYPFVVAYFPEQTVEEGVVFMAVVVGRYGRIELDNRSRLKTSVVQKVLRDIVPDDPVYVPVLDAKTSRLQSLSGITADVLYAAGELFGQTDVMFEIDDTQRWKGGVTVATAGPPLFQSAKMSADVQFLNPFGMADRIDAQLSTDGSSTAQLGATYEIPVGSELDYDLQVNASWSGYRLTGGWAGLGSGYSGVVGVGLARTWTMSTGSRVRGDVSAEHRWARDEFIGSVTSHHVSLLTGAATWTPADGQPTVGYRPDRWALRLVIGQLALGTPAQRALDAATAKTEGLYVVVRGEADWSISLGRGSATVRLSGQWAAKNLASGEKFPLTQKVRSSPVGRGSGDDGWSLQMEYNPGPQSVPSLPGAWLATVFVDAAGITYNKQPWDATGRGGRTAAGAGLRLDWQLVNGWTVRLQQGWTVYDSEDVVAPGSAGPLSLLVTYSF